MAMHRKVFTYPPTDRDVRAALREMNFPRTVTIPSTMCGMAPFRAYNGLQVKVVFHQPGYWIEAPIVSNEELAERVAYDGMRAAQLNFHLLVERDHPQGHPMYTIYESESGGRCLFTTSWLSELEQWMEEFAQRAEVIGLLPRAASDPVQLTADRGSSYGAPEDNHAATADFFSVWLARKYGKSPQQLDQEDTVAFNICQKLSRAANAFKDDNWFDIQGYAQNALDMPGGGRSVGKAPPGYRPVAQADGDDGAA